jgi:hypothetical protein
MRNKVFLACVSLNTVTTVAGAAIIRLLDDSVISLTPVQLALAIWLLGFCATAWIISNYEEPLVPSLEKTFANITASMFCGFIVWLAISFPIDMIAISTTGRPTTLPLDFIGWGLPIWTTGSLIVSLLMARRLKRQPTLKTKLT